MFAFVMAWLREHHTLKGRRHRVYGRLVAK